MKMNRSSARGSDFWAGALASIAIHALAVAILVIGFPAADETVDEERSMEVVLEEEMDSSLDDPTDRVEEMPPALRQDESVVEMPSILEEEREEQPEEPEEEDDESETVEPFDDSMLDRYAVDQQTDGEEPEEADHVSDEAHRTEEETVADVTTLEEVEPPDELEAPEQDIDAPRELAMQVPDEEILEPEVVDMEELNDRDEVVEEVEEVEEEEEQEEIVEEPQEAQEEVEEIAEAAPESQYRDPREMIVEPHGDEQVVEIQEERLDRSAVFGRDAQAAQRMVEEQKGKSVDEISPPREGRQLLANWRENEEALRAALENYLPHVQPGNHTSVNARAAPHATYIARMHRSIHPRWADSFIPRLALNYSSRDPINDRSLEAVIEIVIDAESGEVVQAGPARPSGHEVFDATAISIAQSIGDQPDPPEAIISPDGNVYIHWTFWRDRRRCGTFGASILRIEED